MIEDLSTKIFSELTVIRELLPRIKPRKWICLCSCGQELVVIGYHLKSGHSKRCRTCSNEKNAIEYITHGKTKTRLYKTYWNMRSRCENFKNDNFRFYGGKGVKVCDEWKNSATAFLNWAENNGYSDELTIERIDVLGNYSPENCCWITQKEQYGNRRNTIWISFKGKKQTLTAWAKELGIVYGTLYQRIYLKWPIEKAMSSQNYHKEKEDE